MGKSVADIANFIEMNNEVLNRRVDEWEELNKKILIEQNKLDIESLREKGGKVNFNALTPQVVEEVKNKFPGLTKRLLVRIRVGEIR